MSLLILVRHGESQWNLENRFTGWIDVDLSKKGIKEAKAAGKALKGYHIDAVFTSALKRAFHTTQIILEKMGLTHLHIERSEALNERHYGDLQGLNKAETAEIYGKEQVKLWRRSFDVKPPNGESLKDTQDRVLPYYFEKIEPLLKQGKNVLVSAHGNSLRALVMHLENLSKEKILELNIPTGVPFIYALDEELKIISIKHLEVSHD